MTEHLNLIIEKSGLTNITSNEIANLEENENKEEIKQILK